MFGGKINVKIASKQIVFQAELLISIRILA